MPSEPRDPISASGRRDRFHDLPARDVGRPRSRHGIGRRLPDVAGLLPGPVPARPGCRLPRLARVDPPNGSRDHRLPDPRDGGPGRRRPPGSPVDPLAVDRRGCSRRLSGLPRARDGPAREFRGQCHRPSRRRHDPCRRPRLPAGSRRPSGSDQSGEAAASGSRSSRPSRRPRRSHSSSSARTSRPATRASCSPTGR